MIKFTGHMIKQYRHNVTQEKLNRNRANFKRVIKNS